jgi:hypothetical protein
VNRPRRFLFVSHPAWGHIDFGGLSYLRTAERLVERGHDVRWLLPESQAPSVWRFARAVEQTVARWIRVVRFGGPYHVFDPYRKEMAETARLVERYVRDESVDVIVVDRLSVIAAIGAHAADRAWAVVGGDGLRWTVGPRGGVVRGDWNESCVDMICHNLGITDFSNDGSASLWAVSPWLNLSFFPRSFYGESGALTHFVGGGASRVTERKAVLVALGTSLPPAARTAIVQLVLEVAREDGPPIEVLTGDPDVSQQIRSATRRVHSIDWEPYESAFARASLAVGHGGNGFVWQGIANGIPLLVVSHPMGDQEFGAAQVERLGIGRTLRSAEATADTFAASVARLLGDGPTRERARQLQQALLSGGGIEAAADLLERLARDRVPARACVAPRCCCAERVASARSST